MIAAKGYVLDPKAETLAARASAEIEPDKQHLVTILADDLPIREFTPDLAQAQSDSENGGGDDQGIGEIRTQIFALVERATEQGLGEKYNLRPKAHRIANLMKNLATG